MSELSPRVNPVTTHPFQITSGQYFSTVLGAWMKSRGWVILLPVILFLAIGLARGDERWYIVALMVVFIIGPMVMSMIYTSYMLTPEVRRAVLPKRVTITPGKSLRLEYVSRRELADNDEKFPQSEDFDEKIPQTEDIDEKFTPTEDIDEKLPQPEVIPWSEIAGEFSTSTHKIYRLKGRLQFILIPWSAFPSHNT